MTANISPADQRMIEARAIAPTREALAEMLCLAPKSLRHRMKKLGLPFYERTVRPHHPSDKSSRVCERYEAGESMFVIATDMGMTRNQIAGILHRNGMFSKHPRRKPKKLASRRQAVTRKIITEPKFKAEPFRPRLAAVEPLGLSLLELKPGQCKWPEGDGPFTFCGHPADDNHAYCPHHCRIAYRAPDVRIREPRPR